MTDLITVTRKEQPELFGALVWLKHATNPEDPRAMCHCLHVNDEGVLLSTDGHRMHQVTGVDHTLPEGQYHIKRKGSAAVTLDPYTHEAPLPKLGWEMIANALKKSDPVRGYVGPGDEEQVPYTLYRLITQVGIVGDKTKMGFHPWYLAEALEKCADAAWVSKDSLYLSTMTDAGAYEALVMGYRV